jgi:S-adenosylmethionine:tRNA ribosyltransferase-isomerase
MHTEYFEITRHTLELLRTKIGKVTAVGTTSVRTLESLAALAWRVHEGGNAEVERVIGQWELYDIPADFMAQQVLDTLIEYLDQRGEQSIKAATQIMITPLGYRFRIVNRIVTNFHQPKSTLLLLVSAYVGNDWHKIYDYALANDFRFLSYGDSSLLIVE